MSPLTYLKLLWAWKWPILVVIAFLSGMWFENDRQADKQARTIAEALERQRIDSAKSAFRALERSSKLETSVQSSNTRIDGIKQKIKPRIIYVPITERIETRVPSETCQPSDAIPYLDHATVRLLNAARTELPASDPAPGSDEESRTPSGTSLDTLIKSDLEVVKKYHDLARRHNELVDYVSEEMRKRAGK